MRNLRGLVVIRRDASTTYQLPWGRDKARSSDRAMAAGFACFQSGSLELASGSTAPVTLSSTALGVAGNTIQSGEAADLQFFETDPKGDVNATDNVYVTDFFLKFDGFETEVDDLVLMLELVELDGGGNEIDMTTRAVYVDQGDVYESDTDNTDVVGTRYEPIINDLDNNDALMIVESNDYNVELGDNWVIKGIQILSNNAGLTGDAIDLNRDVAENGGGESSTGAFVEDDTSTGPIKIVDAGFSSTETTPPMLDLQIAFKIVDADDDETDDQTIDIEYP